MKKENVLMSLMCHICHLWSLLRKYINENRAQDTKFNEWGQVQRQEVSPLVVKVHNTFKRLLVGHQGQLRSSKQLDRYLLTYSLYTSSRHVCTDGGSKKAHL